MNIVRFRRVVYNFCQLFSLVIPEFFLERPPLAESGRKNVWNPESDCKSV